MTTINAQYSAIVGGYDTNISSGYSGALGGREGQISGNYAALVGGYLNNVSGTNSVAVGGHSHNIDGDYSVALGGYHAYDYGTEGSVIMPASISSTSWGDGDAQVKYNTVANETTDATQTILNAAAESSLNNDNTSGRTAANGASYFKITLIANVTGGGDTKAWTFEGVVKRAATNASIAFVGTPVKNVIGEDTGAADWDADVQVNTTYATVDVACTGAASTTIRWVAQITMTQVAF